MIGGLDLTLVIIGITVAVSWTAFNNRAMFERLILWPPAIRRDRQYDRFLGYGLIHADWMHLLFNMLTLYYFGRPLEGFFAARVGEIGYLLFYLSALVVSILPSWWAHRSDANYRSLGASGAVSAVLFAFILLSPWTPLYLFFIPIPIPAVLFAVLYVGYSLWMQKRGGDNINHGAHLWGAAWGVLVTILIAPAALPAFFQQLLLRGG
jgi:membrane associated rhomboid family serine protease